MSQPLELLRQPCLAGTITALVTPMEVGGGIDWSALDRLVDTQLQAGIAALCVCGTTAEAATLSVEERSAIIARVVHRVHGGVPVVAGTGDNSTEATLAAQRRAQALGADYGLVVTPYYNKPTQQGLILHYEAIAAGCSLPLIMYNVPSRTGCDMQAETIVHLAQVPHIMGVKEATGDLSRLDRLRSHVPKDFALLSGDDGSACAFVLMGGDGVISVTSNCLPARMVRLVAAARAGDLIVARALQDSLLSVFDVLFIESNPIVVKAAMGLQGQIQTHLRLPLCQMSDKNHARLRRIMQAGGFNSGAEKGSP